MRIFVSSSFEDLREHRAAAIGVLRQLGHEVLAMEDMTAASPAPLPKVLEMVDRSEAYVGIFAWRYGYVPDKGNPDPSPPTNLPSVKSAVYGETSITHYEYLRAVERELPIMAFLLDEHYPWPPQLVDGFDTRRPLSAASTTDIRRLRQELQQERVVSWFTTPSDLAARVSAAVTMASVTRQLDLQPATALAPEAGEPTDTSAEFGIRQAIFDASDQRRALKINLKTTWWSTRIYLMAALADRLTQVRRILIVNQKPAAAEQGQAGQPPQSSSGELFVGQLSTHVIRSTIASKTAQIATFERQLQSREPGFNDITSEFELLLNTWASAFGDTRGQHHNESAAKVDLTAELLRRWFGDSMLQQAVDISDLGRASVVDLVRLLDYPNEYVPVRTRHTADTVGGPAVERVDVMDKAALNARLARSYLVELMDRARIT